MVSSMSALLPMNPELRLVLAGAAVFVAGIYTRGFLDGPSKAYIQQSPRATLLPKLSDNERSKLPYPPDVLPGARDVDTPYGSIRVYEYGPEDGRKVLLVHGISTPAIALGSVANNLAEKGCRVMLFDLFGRGYSDNPSDVKHDIKLFTTQILLVLASSPLSWTGAGSGKFSMIGYSLGGGICTSFTSYFPDLVDSLILFAPAGLIRPHHISRTSRVLYSEGLFPESLLQRLIKSRLRTPLAAPPKESDKTKTVDATEAVQAEANVEYNSQAVLSKKYPHVTVASAVAHQVDHHPGFVAAFMSSIRYGPVREEHQRWRIVGERLGRLNQEQGINRKVLIVCGEHDPIIIKKELEEDATAALLGNVEFATFDAAHEIPVTKGDLVAQTILDFWERDV